MTVFAVLAHDDPDLLSRLVGRLAPYPVVVHVDAKSALAPFVAACDHHSNVSFIVDRRVSVNWGGWSQVVATMRLYSAVCQQADDDEQIVLLSGHCYPLRPVAEIVEFLGGAERPLFVRGVRIEDVADDTRIRHFHPYDLFPARRRGLKRIVFAGPRKLVQRIAPHFPRRLSSSTDFVLSSQWTVLTKSAIIGAIEPAYERLEPVLRWSFAPEECFFATAIYGSGFAAATQEGRPGAYCGEQMADYANIHLLDSSMVKTFTEDDMTRVRSSSALFVRKVDSERSAGLLRALDSPSNGAKPVQFGAS